MVSLFFHLSALTFSGISWCSWKSFFVLYTRWKCFRFLHRFDPSLLDKVLSNWTVLLKGQSNENVFAFIPLCVVPILFLMFESHEQQFLLSNKQRYPKYRLHGVSSYFAVRFQNKIRWETFLISEEISSLWTVNLLTLLFLVKGWNVSHTYRTLWSIFQ